MTQIRAYSGVPSHTHYHTLALDDLLTIHPTDERSHDPNFTGLRFQHGQDRAHLSDPDRTAKLKEHDGYNRFLTRHAAVAWQLHQQAGQRVMRTREKDKLLISEITGLELSNPYQTNFEGEVISLRTERNLHFRFITPYNHWNPATTDYFFTIPVTEAEALLRSLTEKESRRPDKSTHRALRPYVTYKNTRQKFVFKVRAWFNRRITATINGKNMDDLTDELHSTTGGFLAHRQQRNHLQRKLTGFRDSGEMWPVFHHALIRQLQHHLTAHLTEKSTLTEHESTPEWLPLFEHLRR